MKAQRRNPPRTGPLWAMGSSDTAVPLASVGTLEATAQSGAAAREAATSAGCPAPGREEEEPLPLPPVMGRSQPVNVSRVASVVVVSVSVLMRRKVPRAGGADVNGA